MMLFLSVSTGYQIREKKNHINQQINLIKLQKKQWSFMSFLISNTKMNLAKKVYYSKIQYKYQDQELLKSIICNYIGEFLNL